MSLRASPNTVSPAKFRRHFDLVIVHTTFIVLAVGLLAGAVLVYTRSRDLFVPLTVITPILVGFAGARVLLWPDSLPLRMALEVGYRIVLLTACDGTCCARVAGAGMRPAWLLALCLPMLHLAWPPFTDRVPAARISAAEIVLGLSMLLVVFDQARARNRRLACGTDADREHRQRSAVRQRGAVARSRNCSG